MSSQQNSGWVSCGIRSVKLCHVRQIKIDRTKNKDSTHEVRLLSEGGWECFYQGPWPECQRVKGHLDFLLGSLDINRVEAIRGHK